MGMAGESVWTARDLDYKRKRSTAEAKARRAAAEAASAAAAEALANGEAWSLVARAPWAEKVRRLTQCNQPEGELDWGLRGCSAQAEPL